MMNNREATGSKPRFGIGTRILALLLAAILICGVLIVDRAAIRRQSLELAGTLMNKAYDVLYADEYQSKSLFERAWQVLTKGVLKPRTFEEFSTFVSICIARGEYKEAIPYIQGCIDTVENESALADLWLRKGSLYTLTDDTDPAIECYDLALELDPSMSSAYLLRAEMKNRKGFTAEAIGDFKSYISISGANPTISAEIGRLYESLGSYEDAIENYTAAIDSGVYDVALLASRSRCELLLDDFEAGRIDLDRYFDEGGTDENGELYTLLGLTRMQAGLYVGARVAFRSAIENGCPDPVDLYIKSINCALAEEQYDIAVTEGQRAIEAIGESGDTRITEVHRLMGLASFAANDFANALTSFRSVLESAPETENINYYAAVCCMSNENYADAVGYFIASADLGEYTSICHYNAAICYCKDSDFSSAEDECLAAVRAGDDEEAVSSSWELLHVLDELNGLDTILERKHNNITEY